MPHGKIAKLVIVASPPKADVPLTDVEGYGIIRSRDGQEFFFVHSAVAGGGFAQLHRGQDVTFMIEEGPLRRAFGVVPQISDAQRTF